MPPTEAPQSEPAATQAPPPPSEQEGPAGDAGNQSPRPLQKGAEVLESVREHPFVQKVCDMFDGQVIDARATE